MCQYTENGWFCCHCRKYTNKLGDTTCKGCGESRCMTPTAVKSPSRETEFWMQVYLAFVPRIVERPLGSSIPSLTPAEVADEAVIKLRERIAKGWL